MGLNRRTMLKNFWAEHPAIDHLAPIIAVLAWWLTGMVVPSDDATRRTAFTALATLSGLVMAASTFTCTLTYQSANILMARFRDLFSKELRRNWVSVIASNFATAAAPLSALVIDGYSKKAAILIGLYAGALLCVRFSRALYWLQYTLFMQHSSISVPEKVSVPDRFTPSK